MKLILGLGNIGKTYDETYHNVGFMVANSMAKMLGVKFNQKGNDSEFVELQLNGEKVIIAKPTTFMNDSGRCLKQFLGRYPELNIETDVIIVYDDIDLPSGAVRVKEIGGPGTHNGLKSIFSVINTRNFRKVRVGIGERPENVPIVNFVLSKINKKSPVRTGIDNAADALVKYLNGDISYVNLMNYTNSGRSFIVKTNKNS